MTTTRAFDFAYYQLKNHPLDDCLNSKVNGEWVSHSTQDLVETSCRLALGLLKLGIKPGDKVAIISSNRPEWNFADFACQQVGVVTVPLYPTITDRDYQYIFQHAGVKVIFVADREILDKVGLANKDLNISNIYSFDIVEGTKNWKELLDKSSDDPVRTIREYSNRITSDDLLTIIYTSGTTGQPKGVMLSHDNVVSNVLSMSKLLEDMFDHDSRVLSFLPMCHILERTAVYFYTYFGFSIYYAESIDVIGENLKEVKPHMFCTVPRLLEKVYDKIVAKGQQLSYIKRQLFFWSIKLGMRFDPSIHHSWWYRWKLSMANKLVFSKWRDALGGEVIYILSGAAALQPRLCRVFCAAGIPVYEAYGLTETSPGIASNRPGSNRIGTVGRPILGVEVKIAEDGEILCKGPNVMKGYYKDESLTREVIKDGWFHTGDIGVMEDGYIKITDRKKEMFKTSGGKYIAPQLMENKFKESEFIEQIMVLGEGRKFPSALIVPNFELLHEWCKIHSVRSDDLEALVKHPEIQDLYQIEIKKYNKEFGHWEQIKKFELVDKSWGIDTGELTPTLKLKRRVIKEKFESLVDKIYDLSR